MTHSEVRAKDTFKEDKRDWCRSAAGETPSSSLSEDLVTIPLASVLRGILSSRLQFILKSDSWYQRRDHRLFIPKEETELGEAIFPLAIPSGEHKASTATLVTKREEDYVEVSQRAHREVYEIRRR
jgi:hypothetical protein